MARDRRAGAGPAWRFAMEPYGQYCPVARAAEIVAERWTPLIIRELLQGARRFNEIHAGVPRISPSLLSRRLDQLERVGILRRSREDDRPVYDLTEAGAELEGVLRRLGAWGQRWMGEIQDGELDPVVLMKDIQTWTDPGALPDGRVTVEVRFSDVEGRNGVWWLVLRGDEGLEVCDIDPGQDVDLWVTATLRALTRVWLGDQGLGAALRDGEITLEGRPAAREGFPGWLGLSPYADVERATEPLPHRR